MALLIDGYNLMHAAGVMGRGVGPGGLERSRLALLNFIVESIDPAEIPRTVVVFDAAAAPPGLPRTIAHRGLTVRFAAKYGSADELIEELIQSDSAPRRLMVVSSDHRLHRAARRRKATAIDSDAWCAQLLEQRRQHRESVSMPSATKPSAPLADSEVEFWLRQFAKGPDPDEKPLVHDPVERGSADSIFPPGYAEDLEE